MAYVEVSGIVGASPRDVWEVVANEERLPEWFPGITESRVTNGKSGLGAERLVRGDMLGEWTSRQQIHLCELGRLCGWVHMEDTGRPGRLLENVVQRVELHPLLTGSRTEITLSSRFTPKGMGMMMAPVIKRRMRARYRAAIRQLDGLVRVAWTHARA